MKLQILSLSLRNFKGHKKLDIQFNDTETNIFGQNAAGKTTIFDAICYLLFGKDSQDNKTFPVQTLSTDGSRIDHLETEVSATFMADHRKVELKRIYKQKWQKKRGFEIAEYVGNEEDLFVNESPCKLSEYKNKVDSIIQEDIFKMITNVGYFASINWKTRRQYLLDMFGNLSDIEIAGNNPAMVSLINFLSDQGKSMAEYKTEVAAKKRKIKEELITISPRIDEADQAKPQIEDWAEIEKQIKEKSAKIEEIENTIGSQIDSQKLLNKRILEHDNKVFEAERELQKIESALKAEYEKPDDSALKLAEAKKELVSFQNELKENQSKTEKYEQAVISLESELKELESSKEKTIERWKDVNAETFKIDPDKCECPTCKREYAPEVLEDRKEQWEADFNKDKKERLEVIDRKGKSIKSQIEEIKARIENGNTQISGLKSLAVDLQNNIDAQTTLVESLETEKPEKESFDSVLAANENYRNQKSLIEDLKAKAPQKDQSFDTIRKEKQSEKQTIQIEIDQLRLKLSNRERIEKLDQRIEELKASEKALSQELADFEKKEFLMLEFSKLKIQSIEKSINEKFKVVRFKMFRQLINGGEEECCDITVDGVPYESVNQAGKINASLDIINALSDHYGYYAPIILDQRESVSKIIDVNAQVINLIVSQSDTVLRVA